MNSLPHSIPESILTARSHPPTLALSANDARDAPSSVIESDDIKIDMAFSPPFSIDVPEINIEVGADTATRAQRKHQEDRWAQGCQAMFAGFVASAHLQNLRPTIEAFGETPQYTIILSTLESIQARQAKESPANGPDRSWRETLSAVLAREDNRYTTPSIPPVLPASVLPLPVDTFRLKVDIGQQEWSLTSRGKTLFNPRQDGRVASPLQDVPKWWNM